MQHVLVIDTSWALRGIAWLRGVPHNIYHIPSQKVHARENPNAASHSISRRGVSRVKHVEISTKRNLSGVARRAGLGVEPDETRIWLRSARVYMLTTRERPNRNLETINTRSHPYQPGTEHLWNFTDFWLVAWCSLRVAQHMTCILKAALETELERRPISATDGWFG